MEAGVASKRKVNTVENVATGQAEPGTEKSVALAALASEERAAHGFKMTIVYNGVGKEFAVKPTEGVKHLFDQAITAFGVTGNVHMLSLYNPGGHELADALTLKDAGVKPKDELLLRPSAVKAG
jgi:hypothetical protein